jgi:glycosyltransferase involved in cell wall biosynthesis
MKLILINSIHNKNLNALKNYKNIEIILINNINEINNFNLNEIDCIFSPSLPLNIDALNRFANIKFIFGPHFSVLPDIKVMFIKNNNAVYIQPSEWSKNIWKSFYLCNNLNLQVLPFGVDTDKFKNDKELKDRDKVFIYYKYRDPNELEYLEKFLKYKNINYEIFSYDKKYDEEKYLSFLKDAKYGIWLGCHESQGFALEEALSCNVPLLIWDVKTMNQEYNSDYDKYVATCIPYWNELCGEYFYEKENLEETFNTFIDKLYNYNPRKYILDNLTYEICENKLIELINNINN